MGDPGGIVAARQRRAMPAAAATALTMGLLMAYWELMARYYARNRGVSGRPGSARLDR